MAPRPLAFGMALLAALAADAAPFGHAVATKGCTQEDGRALEVVLLQRAHHDGWPPQPPYLRVELPWDAWPALLGRPVALTGLSGAGLAPGTVRVRAAFHPADGAPVQWLAGTLTLQRVDVGRRVDAVYDFSGAGGRWHGSVDAEWLETKQACG